MPGVIVDSLAKAYGGISALENLSFTVEEDELYGLIGPDGAGKTTFMRIAACLLSQDSGALTISGFDTVSNARAVKSRIGYMPQRFSLYPDLTVMENLMFFSDLFGVSAKERKQRVARLLDFSRLGPFTGRKSGNLSGGMKQKLALSCALIHTPELLLLDEPTTGVDPVSRREFWDILAELKNEGTTIIVSTPYMDEAERCDRIGMLFNGAIIAEGEPEEIRREYGCSLLAVRGDDIVRKFRKTAYPAFVTSAQAFGDSIHLAVTDIETTTPVIRNMLEKAGVTSISIHEVAASMDDIFMELSKNPS